MKHVTVLGSAGFVGSHLAAELRGRGHSVFQPRRDEDLTGVHLGTVFYCIGLTADFRWRPFDTVEAHVCKLRHVLENCRFDLLVYLSSTRIYGAGPAAVEEEPLVFNPANAGDLYNLSKSMGESLALHCGQPVRIARLANVYGPDWSSENFLPSLIRAGVRDGRITLGISPLSEKDYVSVGEVVDLLIKIGTNSKHRVYNVASGRNVVAADLLARIQQVCGCAVETDLNGADVSFPPIAVTRIQTEFPFTPRKVLDDLPTLIEEFIKHEENKG